MVEGGIGRCGMDTAIIAVGCAGGRMVNRIIEQARIEAEYLAINTDRRELDACRVSQKILIGEQRFQGRGGVVRKNHVTLLSLQVCSHDAGHPGLNGPSRAGAPEASVGVIAAEPAAAGAAAGSQAPRTYEDALRCSVAPTRAGDAAGGFLSGGSKSPGTLASACPGAAHTGHWLGDSAPEF